MEATAKQTPEFVIRQGNESHGGFIARHWVDSYRNSLPRPWVARMDEGVVKRFLHQTIEVILKRAEVRVAGPPDDADTIYGFAIVERPNTIHFVYTRSTPNWRRMGIAKALVKDFDIPTCTITTWSPEVTGMSGWILSKYQTFKYVPFYMREGDDVRQRKAAARYG